MSTYLLDVPELLSRINDRRTERALSWREVARECGISASTLSRLGEGKRPDADALVSLLVWLDLDTDIAYLIKPGAPDA